MTGQDDRLLQVQGLSAGYGAARMVFGVSLHVERGEVAALLGRNGAGKSTTLKAIMGLLRAEGRVLLGDKDLTGKPPHVICRSGIGYVPQERRIFPDLTVLENLEAARRPGGPAGPERAFDLFPLLRPLRKRRGGGLSGGEQQMLAIARTLMGEPTLLLLDEPSEGLAPRVAQALASQVLRLKGEGLAILLSEQNLAFTLAVSDRAYILEKGRIEYEGPIATLAKDPDIRRRYLMV
jgi:branched-chain amino acid transport system ATP-binding protein